MPSRELKDLRPPAQSENQPQSERPPIQLQVTSEVESTLVQVIQNDYDAAKKARQQKDFGTTSKGSRLDFDSHFKGLKDLYNAQRIPKNEPWQFCSNRSLRIATSIVDMLHARLLPTVLNEDLVRWQPGEVKDKPKVERISKLMMWWAFVRSRVQTFYDIWTKHVISFGDGLTETSWDVEILDSGETISQPIVGEDGNPLQEQDGAPAVSTFRDLRFIERTISHVFQKDQIFLQEGATNILQDPVIIEEMVPYYKLEQGEVEGKFVNITNLLRSKIPVEMDESNDIKDEDRERLRNIKLRNKQVKIQRSYIHFDADNDGFAEDIRITVSLDHSLYLGGIAVKNLTKSGRRALDFTKFDNRIANPNELDGEGILEKVRELAEEIDAIFNQMTDANTLSILRPGFYDPAGDLDAGTLKLAPNRISPVSDPSRNILFPDITIQVTQLMEAIRIVLEFVERLTAASAFVLGKESDFVGGPGTATRTNTITQSAEIRFAIPSTRLRGGASRIMTQHLDILQLNIPPGLETRVMGEKGDPVFDTNELTMEGISGEYDAYLLPDPSQGSKQINRDLWGMFYSILIQNPIVGTDPAKIYRITANLLKAWDLDPVEILGPAPLLDDVDDPEDENTLILQGDFARVRAQIHENHILHIQEHMALAESPSLAFIAQHTPHLHAKIIQFLQQHIQEHQQMMQLMIAITQNLAGGKGGGSIGGGEGGNTETTKGAPKQPGLEQTSGPLAQALGAQRQGTSGPSP